MFRSRACSLILSGTLLATSSLLIAAEVSTDDAAVVAAPASESVESTAVDTPVAVDATVAPEQVDAPSAEQPAPEEQVEQVQQDHAEPMFNPREVVMMDEPTDETHKKVFHAFRAIFQSVPIESISDGPYPGLYEIVSESQILYVDAEVTRLFQGRILDLTTGINLTEARLAGIHIGLINDLGEENMLVYKATNPTNRSITVFTDINCGYCRLLHSEIDTLLEAGIDVRYLMFPRAGLESESRVALESVWCADDPQAAMTSAKAGDPITQISCDTPIIEHVQLAVEVGLRGTPLIYLDNGTALPGYKEASVIIDMINSTEPSTD